jgi:hypothetical protein
MLPVVVASVIIIGVAMNAIMIVTAINNVKASTKGTAFFQGLCNTVVWQTGQKEQRRDRS